MKQRYFLLPALLLFINSICNAQIAINTTGASPDPSAMLDVSGTTRGALMPRMTGAQMRAIGSPATGLMAYRTDSIAGLYYYNGGAWQPVGNHAFNDTLYSNLYTNGWMITQDGNGGIFIGANGEVEIGNSASVSGANAVAIGYLTKAIGINSIATGNNTISQGYNSTAMGSNSVAYDSFSVVIGYNPQAHGTNSIAMGNSTGTYAKNATAMGNSTFANGTNATAMGYYTTASGTNATAMGDSTKASGTNSTAMGDNTHAVGANSTAMGYGSYANGTNATAMGYGSNASGANATAMGYGSQAIGSNTTAMGNSTYADGMNATAMGNSNGAHAANSTAMGNYVGTEAGASGSFIIGDNNGTSGFVSTSVYTANQMMMRFSGGYMLYTDASATVGVQVAAGGNSWSTISDRRKKENLVAANGEDFLKKIDGFKLSSWNYKGQDAKTFRHYGPMAQDFYAAFGKDSYGTIGNDTTINQADMEGVSFIAIQALEKRTKELQKEVDQLKMKNASLQQTVAKENAENEALKAEVTTQNKEIMNRLEVLEKGMQQGKMSVK